MARSNPITPAANTFYASWHEAMSEFTDEQYGRVTRAVNDYCFFGKETELSGIERMVFILARPSIDASIKRKTCGKSGAANRWSNNREAIIGTHDGLTIGTHDGLTDEAIKNFDSKEKEKVKEKETHTCPARGAGECERSGFDTSLEKQDAVSEPAFEPPEKPEALLLRLWQHSAFVNPAAPIKSPNEWRSFWDTSPPSRAEVETAWTHFEDGVRSGAIERRFTPSSPDGFAFKWIRRLQEPYGKKPERRMANDAVDDISRYFTEAL